MSQSTRSKWATAVLVVAVAAFLLVRLWFASDNQDTASDLRITDAAGVIEEQNYAPNTNHLTTGPAASSELASAPCLTLEQLETHPVITQDAYRYEAVVESGPVIAAYRGLSEQELMSLAAQGDSAAMVVLGAMSVMRARDWPVAKAVSFLMHEDPELMAFTFRRPLPPEFIFHMEQAGQWFYQAALHGRVLVLWRVGDALSFGHGGPVELGWISKDEYDSLSSHEKTALNPSNVYSVLALEVAPGLKVGPAGEILAALMPRTEQQSVIVDQLVEQFDRDLQEAGLPPIVMSESSSPSYDDLLALLCESERERLERIRDNVR